MQNNGKLSRRAIAAYGSGDFALNLSMMSVGFWLLYFYTDVFGIDSSSAGFIFLVARIWDAVTDPAMGVIADHTKSRWGKFRPHLLIFNLPLALITVAMFYTPDISVGGKFYYALVMYLLFNTFFTAVNIPYGALGASMTQDGSERTSLATSRTFFAVMAAAVVAIGTPVFIKHFASERVGYTAIMSIYAVVQMILLLMVFASTKERYAEVKQPFSKNNAKQMLKIVFQNKPLMILCAAIFTGMCATTIRNATLMYYFKYYIARPDLISSFLAAVAFALLIGIFLTPPVSKRLGKRNTFLLATMIAIPSNTVLYFTPSSEIVRIFVTCFLAAIGGGFVFALMWSMVPDTVEYGEWKTGVRGEGVIYGVYGFIQKFAMAIGGIVGGRYLDYVGYIPNAAQTPRAMQGIVDEFILFPLVTTVVATIVIYFYPLDDKTFERIKFEIKRRRQTS